MSNGFPTKAQPDGEYEVPIYDCPNCGAQNTPFHFNGPHLIDGKVLLNFFCPNCSWVPHGEPAKCYMRQADVDAFEEARTQKQIRHELGYDKE